MVDPPWLARGADGGSEITLHVQPGAARAGLAGMHGDALKLRVRAQAVEGAANSAVLDFVAEWLGVPKRDLRLLRGERSRRKTLWLPLSPATVLARVTL